MSAPQRDEAQRTMGWLGELVRNWGPAIAAVLLIRAFIFEPFRIPSGSMLPTLLIGDQVLVTKYSYGIWLPWLNKELVDLGDPARGDIIVFRYPLDPRQNYIKRVVGIPGDHIRVVNNQITLNGAVQERDYTGRYASFDDRCAERDTKHYVELLDGLHHHVLTNTGFGSTLANHPPRGSSQREIVVPPGNVFVMGDNRDNSEDSRKWGFVRFDQIKGKARFVWLSWDSCAPPTEVIRTDRFFHDLYHPPEAL
ncbi:MAG: signal peptidase I [Deltaproteobacteria bacterium]|nr:signal peptidase I [Deltaproteobacteria bacterium]